jgi:hypothetical protein
MLHAVAQLGSGGRLAVFGLSADDMRRLKTGYSVDTECLLGLEGDRLVLIAAEHDGQLEQYLQAYIGPDTRVVRHG